MSSPDPPAPDVARTGRPRGAAEVDLAFDADGLYALRATLAAHADHLGARPEQIDDLVLVANELATNAIRHGGGRGRLRLWADAEGLLCEVNDHGRGIVDTSQGTEPPDPRDPGGGRGLWICRQIAEHLVIETGRDGRGTSVTATVLPRDA